MPECHYCGRPMPADNYPKTMPWPICQRANCKDGYETVADQTMKIRAYWTPVYHRYLKRAQDA